MQVQECYLSRLNRRLRRQALVTANKLRSVSSTVQQLQVLARSRTVYSRIAGRFLAWKLYVWHRRLYVVTAPGGCGQKRDISTASSPTGQDLQAKLAGLDRAEAWLLPASVQAAITALVRPSYRLATLPQSSVHLTQASLWTIAATVNYG